MSGAAVSLWRYFTMNGSQVLMQLGESVLTDGAGAFLFPRLGDGRYYIRAETAGKRLFAYYPNVEAPGDATPIDLETGGRRSGLEIRLLR